MSHSSPVSAPVTGAVATGTTTVTQSGRYKPGTDESTNADWAPAAHGSDAGFQPQLRSALKGKALAGQKRKREGNG